MVDDSFGTMRLPGECDAIAPDGSCVRVLLRLARGSMAHFELAAGRRRRGLRGQREMGGGSAVSRHRQDSDRPVFCHATMRP
jgi:hypothetical protein